MAASASWNGRLLYRHILKAAKQFPSIKRDAIVEDIRTEFRANKALADPQQLASARQAALEGLQHLEQYVGIMRESGDWEIYLKGSCLSGPP